jgi:uncharacterized protein YeaC (DUF1315 family)
MAFNVIEHAVDNNIPFSFVGAVREALTAAVYADYSAVIDLRKWGEGMTIDGKQTFSVSELVKMWRLTPVIEETIEAIEADAAVSRQVSAGMVMGVA